MRSSVSASVLAYLKKHDAANPCSFRIEVQGKSIGVLTDLGEPCDNVRTHFTKCNAVFLESNYDEVMLEIASEKLPRLAQS